MKLRRINVFIMIAFGFHCGLVNAHEEETHQFITKHAYWYLEKEIGTIPELKSFMGLSVSGAPRENVWRSQNTIVLSVYDEDHFDPIFNYGSPLESVTHFWNPDFGNHSVNDLDIECLIPSNQSNVPNAFYKALLYYGGRDYHTGFRLRLETTGFHAVRGSGWPYSGGTVRAEISYSNLCEFYQTGECTVHTVWNYIGQKFSENRKITVKGFLRKAIVYSIVGRMLHLLQDMSIPAHIHLDTHPAVCGDGDDYELWMGNVGNYSSWTANRARQEGGLLLEVFNLDDQEALWYLFYNVNQLAQFFPSDDSAGNRWLGHPTNILNYRYSQWGTVPSTYTTALRNQIAASTMPYLIRACATFLYWISAKFGLVDCPAIRYLQSEEFFGIRPGETAEISARDYIIGGKQVRSDIPVGDYRVKAPAALELYASKSVHLQAGVHFEDSSRVHLSIKNHCMIPSSCSSYPYTVSVSGDKRRKVYEVQLEEMIAAGPSEWEEVFLDTAGVITVYVLDSVSTWSADTGRFEKVFGLRFGWAPYDCGIPDSVWLLVPPFSFMVDSLRIVWVSGEYDPPVQGDSSVLFTYGGRSVIYIGEDSTIRDTVVLVDEDTTDIFPPDTVIIDRIYAAFIPLDSNFVAPLNDPAMVEIYPNPNNGEIFLRFRQLLKKGDRVEIVDIHGQVVDEKWILTTRQTLNIQMRDFSPGMYIVRIWRDGMLRAQRSFVILR